MRSRGGQIEGEKDRERERETETVRYRGADSVCTWNNPSIKNSAYSGTVLEFPTFLIFANKASSKDKYFFHEVKKKISQI